MGRVSPEHVQWRNDWRPPIAVRPAPGTPLTPGLALMLVLDSIPTVASGRQAPVTAPLTPEEAEKVSAYIQSRPGPAGHAERMAHFVQAGRERR